MGILTSFSILLAATASVHAGYNAASKSNVVLYWGQNSAGQQSTQSRLSTYCAGKLMDFTLLFMLLTLFIQMPILMYVDCWLLKGVLLTE